MILGFMNANAQEPDKINQLKQTVSQFADAKLLKDLQTASGIEWSQGAADKLFKYEPDAEKAPVRDITDLDLGPYTHVAKVVNSNHTQNGGLKYLVDISDRSYLQSNIFNKIKEFNSELNGVEIQFSIKGTVIPTKTIKL